MSHTLSNNQAPDTHSSTELPEGHQIGHLISSPSLKRLQHAHSVAMVLLGFAGVLLGTYRAVFIERPGLVILGIFLLFFIFGGLGITAGFHRLFTHRSFKATPTVRAALAILGCMAGQGPVVFWVALHRWHHHYADRDGDPHSPNLSGAGFRNSAVGLWHAYLGWTVTHDVPNANYYARDILRDPLIMAINRRYYLWVALGLLLPAALAGGILRSWEGALDGLIWGGMIRMFVVHQLIYWLTSFAHVFGKRDFHSRDRSTNTFWMALPTLGEAWHNNHHAFPHAAVLSFRWWQLDVTGLVIRFLALLGAAWDVQRPSAAELDGRRISRELSQSV